MTDGYNDSKNPCRVLLQVSGSIWLKVLPYCVLNVLVTVVVYFFKDTGISYVFSAQGHAFMSLIVSFLVVQKINLAFDRYMKARVAIGRTLVSCRDLHQMVMTFTANDASRQGSSWRLEARNLIIDTQMAIIGAIKDSKISDLLTKRMGRNQYYDGVLVAELDPMSRVHVLRMHLFWGLGDSLVLLEKIKLLDHVKCLVDAYEELLVIASTPLPFALVQMGRTFLFLWIFSMPCVLVGHVFKEVYSAIIFVFFLTYGFVGLEFVGTQMLHPFGDDENDLGVTSLAQSMLTCIDLDARLQYHPPTRAADDCQPHSGEQSIYQGGRPWQDRLAIADS